MRDRPMSAMQFRDLVEQILSRLRGEAHSLDVLDAWAVFVSVVFAELRDARVRPEQRQRHERTRQSTPTTATTDWFHFMWQPKAGLAYSVSYTQNQRYTKQSQQL